MPTVTKQLIKGQSDEDKVWTRKFLSEFVSLATTLYGPPL